MFRLVLKPDARISTKQAVYKSQNDKIAHLTALSRATHDPAEQQKLRREIDFHRDLGRHAASIGIDAYSVGQGGFGIKDSKGHTSRYMVILNRTATAVRIETEKPHDKALD